MILFYFMYKIAFDNRLKYNNCYNNYIYKKAKIK